MYKYAREHLKRVPLDMQQEDYNALKQAADKAGIPVNRYIKIAIQEKMTRDLNT